MSLITHQPDPVVRERRSALRPGCRRSSTTRCWPRSWATTATPWASATSGRSSPRPRRWCSATSRRARRDPAVHRGHHAEPARPGPRVRGLRDARQPVRRPAGADHRQGQRRRAGGAVPRHHRGPVGPQPRGLRAVPAAVAGGEGHLGGPFPAVADRRRGLPAPAAAADPDLARQRDEQGFGGAGRPLR